MSYACSELVSTYRFPAVAIDTDAIAGRIVGPAGRAGTLIDIAYVITADITAADSTLQVGTEGDRDAYGTTTAAVGTANSGGSGLTRGATQTIPAGSVVTVGSDGGATAGDGDILVTISWM